MPGVGRRIGITPRNVTIGRAGYRQTTAPSLPVASTQPAAATSGITATTQLPPNVGGANLDELWAKYKERLSSDTTGRAIDRATSSIADAAAGRKSAQATQLARRGVLGTGVGDQESGKIDAASQRAQAGAAADISLGRERQLDALVLGGSGIAGAPGQYALDRERVGQGWATVGQGQAGLDLEQQRLQDQRLAQWLAMMQQFN